MSKHADALRDLRGFGPEHWEHLYGLIKERDQLLAALRQIERGEYCEGEERKIASAAIAQATEAA
jgi:hypothetical protein